MIYCIRLCVLQRMLLRFSHPKICWPMRPRTGGLKRFARFRDRFMCHSCQSSIGELLSLRSYGRALSRADGPNFRVHWDESGDTVGWEGGTLSMDQLRNLGRKALERAQYSMDRLLYGSRPSFRLKTCKIRCPSTDRVVPSSPNQRTSSRGHTSIYLQRHAYTQLKA
jgi:hypothetical protein